ncbi:DUF7674 family protein [Parapedobacter sp. DT-150]|uniref:DUF7674 family protein n=1 Tax=Parapedobacter sp. DT-150 TaxID=3396162 RepID=UPI003F1CD82F
METINQNELSSIIESELPEVKDEIVHLTAKDNVAGAMQIVATYMRDMMQEKKLAKVVRCMKLVGWLYGRGNDRVRDIIANVFVRSFNGLRNACSQWEWVQLREQMPANLYSVYVYQNRTSNR